MMPSKAAEPRQSPPPAPIRAGKHSVQDQLAPPLLAGGLEAVRDPHC